jgi:uncharacterized protein HemX
MVSKEEAEATFRSLVTKAEVVTGAVAPLVATGGRNYKLIIAAVVVVLLLGFGAWWWFRGRKPKLLTGSTPAPRGTSSRVAGGSVVTGSALGGLPGSK